MDCADTRYLPPAQQHRGADEVLSLLVEAEATSQRALGERDEALRQALMREACHGLYRAAQVANRQFTAGTPGGLQAQGGCFTWATDELAEFTRVLYRHCFIDGGAPRYGAEAHFQTCLARVRRYCMRLMAQMRVMADAIPAEVRSEERAKQLDYYRDAGDFYREDIG
jgi:hypothetical protein